MLASYGWHKEIVELLLQHWADVNIQDKKWKIALTISNEEWHKEIVELLLNYWAVTKNIIKL